MIKANQYKKWLVLPLAALTLAGCNESDFLTKVNPNKPNESKFWKDKKDVEAAMATVYSPVRSQMYGWFGAFDGLQSNNGRADDYFMILPEEPTTRAIVFFNNTPTNGRDTYAYMYRSIQRANVLLDRIDDVPMDEESRKQLKGEACFLRGFNYFILAYNYGSVPLHLTSADNSSEETRLPNAPVEDVWKQVEADLKVAKENLPIERPASEAGRVTKGAAIAYLGKAYLFQNKFAEAKTELELIMNAPYKYDLVPDYQDNFTEANELNEESIFELVYDGRYGDAGGSWNAEGANDTQGMVWPNFIGPNCTSGWFKMMPSAALIEEFIAEERPAGSDTKFDKRLYTTCYFKHSDCGDVKPDERWYGGIYDFDTMWESTVGKRAGGEPDFPVINGTKGRFLYKKYTNFFIESAGADGMYVPENKCINVRVMRFAEVLLMHAETAVKAGDLAAANADLARIRERAGLAPKTWNSADELMKEIQHQCFIEFALEGKRFDYLKHWFDYPQIKQIFLAHDKQGAANFQEKHLWYPIPQGELDSNPSAQQNPLWK